MLSRAKNYIFGIGTAAAALLPFRFGSGGCTGVCGSCGGNCASGIILLLALAAPALYKKIVSRKRACEKIGGADDE